MGEFDFDDDEIGVDVEYSVRNCHPDPAAIFVKDGGGGAKVDSVDGGEDVGNALFIREAKLLCRRMAAINSGCAAEPDI